MIGIGRLIAVVHALARYENGATAGTLAKVLPELSKSQIEITLKGLVGEGSATVEVVPHRPNIHKNIYHLDKSLIDQFEEIVKTYDAALHPVRLFDGEWEK